MCVTWTENHSDFHFSYRCRGRIALTGMCNRMNIVVVHFGSCSQCVLGMCIVILSLESLLEAPDTWNGSAVTCISLANNRNWILTPLLILYSNFKLLWLEGWDAHLHSGYVWVHFIVLSVLTWLLPAQQERFQTCPVLWAVTQHSDRWLYLHLIHGRVAQRGFSVNVTDTP